MLEIRRTTPSMLRLYVCELALSVLVTTKTNTGSGNPVAVTPDICVMGGNGIDGDTLS
jgi:hypothetical protein